MPKNEVYRDLYSKELHGLRWDENRYEVHHIDGDHTHNVIENLVLLPKELHKAIHGCYGILTMKESLSNFFTLDYADNLDAMLFGKLSVTARKFYRAKELERQFVGLREFIRNSEWANLDFSHDFERYFRLFSVELYEKYGKK